MSLSDHLYDDDYTPPDMSDPDMAFSHAIDVIESVSEMGFGGDVGIPSHIENALQDAWGVVYAWESFMAQSVPRESDCCTHCERPGGSYIGDVVAPCSHCGIRACSMCWDRCHAETCSDE